MNTAAVKTMTVKEFVELLSRHLPPPEPVFKPDASEDGYYLAA